MHPVVFGIALKVNFYRWVPSFLRPGFCVIPDASYSDPLGPQMERPKTAARRKDPHEDEFGDEELGDDLLAE